MLSDLEDISDFLAILEGKEIDNLYDIKYNMWEDDIVLDFYDGPRAFIYKRKVKQIGNKKYPEREILYYCHWLCDTMRDDTKDFCTDYFIMVQASLRELELYRLRQLPVHALLAHPEVYIIELNYDMEAYAKTYKVKYQTIPEGYLPLKDF
jgi:hypothetical protein